MNGAKLDAAYLFQNPLRGMSRGRLQCGRPTQRLKKLAHFQRGSAFFSVGSAGF